MNDTNVSTNTQPERVDALGAVSARMFTAIKKRPHLRARGMGALVAGSRAFARARHPFHNKPGPYSVVESSADWAKASDDVTQTTLLSSELSINPPPPSVAGIVDWEYRKIAEVEIPAPFLMDIQDGHAVGEHGVVIGPDGSLVRDLSLPVGGLRSFMWNSHGYLPDEAELGKEWRLPPRRLKGKAALLTSYVGRGYFHWVFDVLPRISLLIEAGLDLEEIDHFILPGNFARFQVETLKAWGIPRSKIVSSLINRHVIAESLLVPSLVRQTGLVPEWACKYLRGMFPPERPTHVEFGERLYLGRKVTDHGFVRGEEDLVAAIRDYGFIPIDTEDLTFREKVWVFGQAEAIISPEGAGLSNIVFGKPGAKVFELRVRDLPAMDFSVIANRVGMDFYDVYGSDYQRNESEPTASQGPVTSRHILETLEFAGLER